MTFLEGLAIVLFVVAMLTMGAAITLSNGAVTRAIRRLEQTYRQQKAWEREQRQAAELAAYQATLAQQLRAEPELWKTLVAQLVQRAYGTARQPYAVTLRAAPTPRAELEFGDGGPGLWLTPDLRAQGLPPRAQELAVPVDAVLHPQARAVATGLWECWWAAQGQPALVDGSEHWALVAQSALPRRGQRR